MEAAKASPEDLSAALKGLEAPELREMGKRLSKNCKDLEQLLEDLAAEQQSLKDEKAQLTETIELMMRELRKLNIGAENTVEPVLISETPIDIAGAVGRMWEKVRPRDNAVVVSEHVGELKKPGQSSGEEVTQSAAKVAEKLTESVSAWGSAIGPWWQTAQQNLQNNLQNAHQNLQNAHQNLQTTGEALLASAQEGAVGATASAKSLRSRWLGEGGGASPAGSPGGAAASSPAAAAAAAAQKSAAASEPPASAAAPAAAPAPAPAPAPAAPAPSPEPAPEAVKPSEPALPQVDAAHTEEVVNGTILIEADITLEDGSVHKIYVRAADRCKQVAQRFTREHSLKEWFTDPLTNFLKKVENDAEEFPVKTQAELADIRKNFSKGS